MNLDRIIAVRNTKTLYRDGGRCIKVFSSSYTDADVIGEAFYQASALTAGLNVPRIYDVSMCEGKWAITSELIRGQTLAELIAGAPERLDDYITLLAKLQVSIYSVSCPPLRSLRDMMNERIKGCELSAPDKSLLRSRLELISSEKRLLHGHFEPSNIMIDRSGTPYILGWSQAAQGDIAADIALSYMSLLAGHETALAKRYLEKICALSCTDRDRVIQWLPAAAAFMSVNAFGSKREYLLKYAIGNL